MLKLLSRDDKGVGQHGHTSFGEKIWLHYGYDGREEKGMACCLVLAEMMVIYRHSHTTEANLA